MNKLPDANKEFNNQVISILRSKAATEDLPLKSIGRVGAKEFFFDLVLTFSGFMLRAMHPINYEPSKDYWCCLLYKSTAKSATMKIPIVHLVVAMCFFLNFVNPQTCHYKHLASLLLICDGCNNREHHIYCISPPVQSIPEGAWYCPECLQKRQAAHPESTIPYQDSNYSLNRYMFSPSALKAIDIINKMLQGNESSKENVTSVLQTLSMIDLLQVQTCNNSLLFFSIDFLVCSNRIFNRL